MEEEWFVSIQVEHVHVSSSKGFNLMSPTVPHFGEVCLITLPGKEVQNVGLVELLMCLPVYPLQMHVGLGCWVFSLSSVEGGGFFWAKSLCVQDNFHFCPVEVLKCKWGFFVLVGSVWDSTTCGFVFFFLQSSIYSYKNQAACFSVKDRLQIKKRTTIYYLNLYIDIMCCTQAAEKLDKSDMF